MVIANNELTAITHYNPWRAEIDPAMEEAVPLEMAHGYLRSRRDGPTPLCGLNADGTPYWCKPGCVHWSSTWGLPTPSRPDSDRIKRTGWRRFFPPSW